ALADLHRAVALADELDDLAVGVSAASADEGLLLRTTVLGPDGTGLDGLRVAYELAGTAGARAARAEVCGIGCYQARVAAVGRPRTLGLRIERPGRPRASLNFSLPSRWPAPSAAALVARARHVFAGLRSVEIHERLASNAHNALFTTYRMQAPDRMSYTTSRSGAAVVIGTRRWDRPQHGGWQEKSTMQLRMPALFWGARVTNARVLGAGRV